MATFLDTNVLIYYLTGEDHGKATQCLGLLERAERREEDLITSDLVIAEVVWVLQSKTDLPRSRLRDLLLPIIRMQGLRVPNKRAWPRVFDLYCEQRIDFIDAYNAVLMERTGVSEIYSYDRDFDRVEGISRKTP